MYICKIKKHKSIFRKSTQKKKYKNIFRKKENIPQMHAFREGIKAI